MRRVTSGSGYFVIPVIQNFIFRVLQCILTDVTWLQSHLIKTLTLSHRGQENL